MKTREEILQALRQFKKELGPKYKLARLSLFGSYARGDQTDKSDVDILIGVDPSIGLEFVTLADQIEKAVGLPVDVVSERAIKHRYLQAIRSELIDV